MTARLVALIASSTQGVVQSMLCYMTLMLSESRQSTNGKIRQAKVAVVARPIVIIVNNGLVKWRKVCTIRKLTEWIHRRWGGLGFTCWGSRAIVHRCGILVSVQLLWLSSVGPRLAFRRSHHSFEKNNNY